MATPAGISATSAVAVDVTQVQLAATAAANAAFRIIFQNPELVVINKPHGVAMDGERPPGETSVALWTATALKDFLAEPLPQRHVAADSWGGRASNGTVQKQLKFCHQLDYATSGVLCLPFSREMAARLAHCFEMRNTVKEYLALVRGWIPASMFDASASLSAVTSSDGAVSVVSGEPESLRLDWPIGEDSTDPEGFRMAVIAAPAGKKSSTVLKVLDRGHTRCSAGALIPCTKVLLTPASGRRHQLRVHCATLGFPIIGDATYDSLMVRERDADCPDASPSASAPIAPSEAAGNASGIRFPRMMLHAWSLALSCRVDIADDNYGQVWNERKKRRRETKGLEEHDSQHKTTFVAEDAISPHFVTAAVPPTGDAVATPSA